MSNKAVGFIGGGRVTRIFLEGWTRVKALPDKLVVSDCNAETLAKLKERFPKIEAVSGNSGAARTLLESGLTPAEVMDLIPVKPLADMEPQGSEMYRTRLPGLYQKIKP